MDKGFIERKLEDARPRAAGKQREAGQPENEAPPYYDIVALGAQKPVFSSDLLEFWCPLGSFPPYREGYDVGLCRIKKKFTEFDRMERHLNSVEVIVPVNGDLFVPVAPPGASPSLEDLKIITVRVGEMLNLHEGVWHFACGPLKKVPLDYFVYLKRNTPTADLEIKDLPKKVRVAK
jgi:hypothetical protein